MMYRKAQKTVKNYTDMINHKNLYLVGSLDYGAQGAVLLTDNGVLSYKLTHPSFKVQKKYIVKVRGIPSESSLNLLTKKNKEILSVRNLGITHGKNAWLYLNVYNGSSKKIENLFWKTKTPIIKLIRNSFAKISVDNLKVGNLRLLTRKEILILYRQVEC